VSVGRAALFSNTTGANNVAIGFEVMKASTSATENTAMGQSSMQSNTTGSGNAAFGRASLYSNTTGPNNTAIGKQALYSNTTATQNTAVGVSAMYFNTTGSYNTATGYEALKVNTTGIVNTCMGYQAGDAITTGDANILIGAQSGSSGENLTTGSQNIVIGAYAHTQGTNNAAIAIGYDTSGATNTTTIGFGSSDIRATHGVATWSTVSDERYKKDIVDSTAGLSFVNALQPRTFKYKNKGELPTTFTAYKADSTEVFKNSDTNHGFIAQEVKAAIDADSSIKDGFRMWGNREDGSQEIAEAALIPILVKAIKDLSTKNDALEARLTLLEG
jgi:hypothetical protein